MSLGSTNALYAWIRLPLPLPPEDLLYLAERTTAAIDRSSKDLSERELDRHRQIALRSLGSTVFDAIAGKTLYDDFGVTGASELSLILNEIDRILLAPLSEQVVNESKLTRWVNDENTLAQSRRRAVSALLTLLGIYCFAGMTKEAEVALLPLIADELRRSLPLLRERAFDSTDWKTILQEITQSRAKSGPVYEVIEEVAPDHEKSFTVRVTAPGVGTGTGTGRSKKAAEIVAARSVLQPLLKKSPNLTRRYVRSTKEKGRIFNTIRRIPVPANRYEIPTDAPIMSLCANPGLVRQALTHKSFSGEFGAIAHYDGLAKLGSDVLKTYFLRKAIHALWNSDIVRLANHVVGYLHRTEVIAQLYDTWGLNQWVLLSRAQRPQGCTTNMKEDFIQALAGACYLEADSLELALTRWDEQAALHFLEHIKRFQNQLGSESEQQHITFPTDPKTLLQEVAQIIGYIPEYQVWQEIGPPHSRQYRCAVRLIAPESKKTVPWLVARPAPQRSKGDQEAARAYLQIIRAWLQGGSEAVLRLFGKLSSEAVEIVKQAAFIAVQSNFQADQKQLRFLQRIGMRVLPDESNDLEDILNRLIQIDKFLGTEEEYHIVAERAGRFLERATSPRYTVAEIQNLLDSLSSYLTDVRPETWGESSVGRRALLEQLISLPSLLKRLSADKEIVDLTAKCQELAREYNGMVIDIDDGDTFLVSAIPGFLDWLLLEAHETVGGELSTFRLFPFEHALEIHPHNQVDLPSDRRSSFERLLACKELMLFGAGIKGFQTSKQGVRLIFQSADNGPLITFFMQEGRKQLCQLTDFGLTLHDAKNTFSAVDVLWNQSLKDHFRRYRRLADIEERLENLRLTVAALKLQSEMFKEPSKKLITLADLVDRYRQRVIHYLPSSIDFSTFGDHRAARMSLCLDEDLMFHALDNIVKNSREALGETTGEIRLEWVVDEKNAVALLSISDTGPGIPKEIIERVLVEGYSTKKITGGTGLGLRSVKRIMESHGGQLTIHSQFGKGTRVDIELPLAQPEAQEPEGFVSEPLSAERETNP